MGTTTTVSNQSKQPNIGQFFDGNLAGLRSNGYQYRTQNLTHKSAFFFFGKLGHELGMGKMNIYSKVLSYILMNPYESINIDPIN